MPVYVLTTPRCRRRLIKLSQHRMIEKASQEASRPKSHNDNADKDRNKKGRKKHQGVRGAAGPPPN